MRRIICVTLCYCVVLLAGGSSWSLETTRTDLLIVGGNEAAVAAAVQAAHSGVERITVVNDIAMLGGQFSAEAVGAIDEWTIVDGKRTNFPRSGLFLRLIEQISQHNVKVYGKAQPGNAWTASDTVEPHDADQLFRRLLFQSPLNREPRASTKLLSQLRPVAVSITRQQAIVDFAKTDDLTNTPVQRIEAELVIDCSDWGDVIRLAGAEYFAGADPRARFDEPSAPENPTESDRNEMNPISYCVVARQTNRFVPLSKPPHYDERCYYGATNATRPQFDALGWPKKALYLNVPPFVDNDYPLGIYSQQQSVYTQRRLVDAQHNDLATKFDVVLFNWVVQDYPLYNFPQWVVDALEKTAPGASRKNIVDMTHEQRQIVFADAKQQSLGMLYFLRHLPDAAVADRFRKLALVDDFGTDDGLPPKPYVREGLRLHALSMLREQDIRTPHNEPRWAKVMPTDALFGFQFNIDFHPTRRQFLNDDPTGPWVLIHTPTRNWSTHTDRAMLSARSLVPVQVDRLIGSSKNIGLTSITSAALRLHGQMMLTGQASGAVAALCLSKRLQPREVVARPELVEQLQRRLVAGVRDSRADLPGVLLWPYHDLRPTDRHFVAANMLTAWQILPPLADSVYFQPDRTVTNREMLEVVRRAVASLAGERPQVSTWPQMLPADEAATSQNLLALLTHCQLTPQLRATSPQVTRASLASLVWSALEGERRWYPDTTRYLEPGHDADGDGLEDRRDPLPFDRDNDSLPDRLDTDTAPQ